MSTPQPEDAGGRLQFVYGQDHQTDMLASYGAQLGAFGFNLETAQRYNEGFKSIDRSSQDTGYRIEDYVRKNYPGQGERHALKLKAQYSDETSDETYLGLTDRDFAENPDRRYGMSAPGSDEQRARGALRHLGLAAWGRVRAGDHGIP